MNPNTEVMLDLETLSIGPKPALLAIGAVKMDMTDLRITDRFYVNVNAETCQAAGLEVDASTVMWWLKQSDHARQMVTAGGSHLAVALQQFSAWLGGDIPVWSKGAAEDCAWLQNVYKACAIEPPWTFRRSRCFRTLAALFPYDWLLPPPNRKAHDALADAEWQAEHFFNIVRLLRRREALL